MIADAGYTGADKRPEREDRDVSWNIAIKRSIIKALPKDMRDLAEPVERALAQLRAPVEHPFHIVKDLFRHKKLRYRGLFKNTAQLYALFALANLVIAKKILCWAIAGLTAPGVCLDPKNSSGSAPPARILYPQTVTNCAPVAQALPRPHKRRPPQHCSAFP